MTSFGATVRVVRFEPVEVLGAAAPAHEDAHDEAPGATAESGAAVRHAPVTA